MLVVSCLADGKSTRGILAEDGYSTVSARLLSDIACNRRETVFLCDQAQSPPRSEQRRVLKGESVPGEGPLNADS